LTDGLLGQSQIVKFARQIPRRALLAFAASTFVAAPASAQDVWAASEFEASITLPAPEPGSPVRGAVLSCAAQVWTLVLSLDTDALVAGADGTAVLAVPRETFEAPSKALPAGIEITVPHRALEPIKAATRLSITFEGGTDEIRFPLTGSRRAINAAEGLCTPRVMPLANSVPLTPYSSYLMLARKLRKSDIDDFVLSTTAEPKLRAGMVEIGEGRRLLFVELCGSTWYYGVSGCNLAGYAPVEGEDAAEPEGWRPVYETEGVFLYVDPNAATDGWPDLIAIAAKTGDEETRWRWTGGEYAIAETDVVGDTAAGGQSSSE